MIQAKLIGLVLKALFKSDIFQGLIKYKDEDNELDIKVRDLEKNITDIGFKHTAVIDMVKGYSETIDNVEQNVKSIDKVIKKVEKGMIARYKMIGQITLGILISYWIVNSNEFMFFRTGDKRL